jgi:hypothetical protein
VTLITTRAEAFRHQYEILLIEALNSDREPAPHAQKSAKAWGSKIREQSATNE